MPSSSSLRICICVCICICVIVFVYLHLQICACICTVICSCLGISVQTNITAFVCWIAFITSWPCICHWFVDMYFSRTGSVFLSQILHISTWHHSGTGARIRIFGRAKSIRIKFPKPWAHCPTMEIICCSARLNLMPQNGSWRPLQSLKTDEHPPNEDLFFGRLLGNSFEDDHNHQHNHQSYHHHHVLNVQGEEFKQFCCCWNPILDLILPTALGPDFHSLNPVTGHLSCQWDWVNRTCFWSSGSPWSWPTCSRPTCSRVRPSPQTFKEKRAPKKGAKNGSQAWYEKTICWQPGAQHSAVFQVRHLKFWT